MIVVVIKDITTSSYLENKGKSEKIKDQTTIALIDSGVNFDQVNYDKNIKITKYNAIDNSTNVFDNVTRGTLIFSSLYNEKYSLQKSNDVLVIKAFDDTSEINPENVARALNYACTNSADVVNIAFIMAENVRVTEEIENCQLKGTTIVAVSSSNSNKLSYPASLKNVISVSLKNVKDPTTVKVDPLEQIVCYGNSCKPNAYASLSVGYVSGYLVDYKDRVKKAQNLVLRPTYSIEKVNK